ncbi:ribosome maturation factor RimM [Actinopolymorpha singaporensis]|uniref:Ribosome maturation factor RimM n=1 Tax=Actinopolymorpha singaporensis TaxID=117157 RepID=A0A1H1Y1Q6_9ACTN|nr:ribosome maturation factor RimM [Actinopolymorpha singaporensis]SDT15335.1 16S rRNA processing protein RimM [Actinopolymorpha singaporensis]
MELLVGRIGRAHGLRGEVAVTVRTDAPEERFVPGASFATDAGDLRIDTVRWSSGRLLVSFDGVRDRTAAERLRGTDLVAEVPDDERPEDPDEFYDHQLVGLAAVTVAGENVGEVTEVVHLPMQDLLAVRTPDAGEVLVPFVAAIVPEVDLEHGRVIVDPPPGLLGDVEDDDVPERGPEGSP